MPKGYYRNGAKRIPPSAKGRKRSLATRLKMSIAAKKTGTGRWRKGVKMSEATKEKLRQVNLGKKHSPETLLKMSEAQSGSKSRFWQGGIWRERLAGGYYDKLRRARKLGAEGGHSVDEWELLKAQYNWTCPSCRRQEPNIKLTADHIIPLARGGSHNIENIQPLCGRCNSRKSTKTIKY